MSSLVPESSLDILTRRESEILGLVADGFSNQEIADTLFITIHTVKEHLKHVFAKLDVRRRTEAVVRARELGILGASEKSSPSSNLPAAILPLVGREQELSQLEALLSDPDIRLVTLHGIGGVGKTHLALTAGSRQQASFADGVFLISLASLDSPLFFAPALAEALNVKLSGRGNAMQELLGHLRDKHLLLIMDSFEHMLDCTSFIGAILSAASRVKVLVTSRERLGMFGEVVYKLHGVRYPAENMADNLPDYGAVQLFLHNARCINNHFEASAEDITLIARICRFVEGLPLGILLATSWLNVLPMGDILNEISEDVYALDHSGTQVEYQSLRYVFQRSWEMLSPEQQKVLMWLAVFRERFTRQAAEQVASATLSDLNVLVNKSLLQAEPDLGHYSLHELLRQDGRVQEQLLRAGVGRPRGRPGLQGTHQARQLGGFPRGGSRGS
jgi:predicted ATPase/DNA-binding CsgD family transcriptional regulator